MDNELFPLKRQSSDISYNDFDDVFVFVPYKKKNSSVIRNFVKNLGGRYDSIRQRWFIPISKLSEEVKKNIEKMNLYDGLKFNYRDGYPNVTNGNISLKLRLETILNSNHIRSISKHVQFDKYFAVQYYSFNNQKYVIEAFVDTRKMVDLFPLNNTALIMCDIIPIEYARSNWIHYSSKAKNNVKDIDKDYVTGIVFDT